jgi:uncharacterized protein (TIGR03790 family)
MLCLGSLRAKADLDASQVIVLINSNEPTSQALAQEFIQHRQVAADHLIALPMPTTETITWAQYSETILNPLRKKLLSQKILSGKLGDTQDNHGRLDFIPQTGSHLQWIITLRGVPLKIKNSGLGKSTGPLKGDHASVDSELTLVANVNLDPEGALPNPWFGKAEIKPEDTEGFVRVTRLDGPQPRDVAALLLSTWQAEANGLRGRGYLDRGGPYGEGDTWLQRTGESLSDLGFPLSKEETPQQFAVNARADAPAFYFGWYSQKPEGVFGQPHTRFAPGAMALHIHSFSATTLRDPEACWTPWLIQQGAAFTFGNVDEPFLTLSLRPDLFIQGLQKGLTAGEAAWYATPSLSWQGVVIGDPFYRPFAVPLDQQVANFKSHPHHLGAYAILRAWQLKSDDRSTPASWSILEDAYQQHPSLALALALCQGREARGQPLIWPSKIPSAWTTEDPGLILESSQFLAKHGQTEAAKALQALLPPPR